MMCDDMRKLVAAYVDSELETSEILQAQEHLEGCAACRLEVATQRDFRALVASPFLREQAPAHLSERISARLAEETEGRVRRLAAWVNVRPAMALAASLLLTIVGVGTLMLSSRSHDHVVELQRFMSEAVDDHIRDNLLQLPLGVTSGKQATVRQWLESRLGTAGAVPVLSPEGAVLQGSRVCYLFERRAAHISYSRNGSRISFFIITDDGVQLPDARVEEHRGTRLHVGSLKGYNAICWKKAGMAYALVANSADVPQDELLRLARRALEPPESI